MSRTDKTNPFLVRLWDGTLARVARHDHTNGRCDLPTTMAEHLATFLGNGATHQCTWELDPGATGVCCCVLCRAQPWERRAQKGRRRRTHMRLQELRKTWFADDAEDFD